MQEQQQLLSLALEQYLGNHSLMDKCGRVAPFGSALLDHLVFQPIAHKMLQMGSQNQSQDKGIANSGHMVQIATTLGLKDFMPEEL